ncbi:zinc-finger of the FCS-type, C2-C2 [Carex littledalei]|uniref:Zinc-finger of the FCS-type, C2-C2 n=1 Tax=Carex littledalei TaxID=544730 RepID=A0A833QRT0_9POAL|nr:zinc-finger of the FCS-type, C2-C2 [Carex littledalei]
MMLGKRQRPPMRRTTSMSEFYLEEILADVDESHQSETQNRDVAEAAQPAWMRHMAPASSMLSPRGTPKRNSGDFVNMETASFLKACGLCNRRLAPGRDIFMYRGEIAFCSMECRQQQINQDEFREKCALKSMSQTANTGADQSSNSETMAAA